MKFQFNRKKAIKITAIVLASILALLLVLVITLPFIIKAGIQTVGSDIAGVPITVKNISLNLLTGTLEIHDLLVGNPKGYSTPHAFKLGKFHASLKPSSLLSRKLLITRIEIRAVELNYEIYLLNNNISDIQANVNRSLKLEEKTVPAKPEEPKAKESGGKVLQIDSLELSDITVWVTVKGARAGVPLMAPPVSLHNLGTGPDGITPAAVVNDVLISLLTSLGKMVGADIAGKAIGDAASSAGKALDDTASSAGQAVGDAASSLGGALKGLIGKDKK
ncbi:MAG: hypothetical protein BWY31_01025 [Lentisphaerae bacterium ADurb.Bin242]|nr:MAG: hypothetical protein BWY31_01025 [Lentisphaerae bacterium ADurb.Bin242]